MAMYSLYYCSHFQSRSPLTADELDETLDFFLLHGENIITKKSYVNGDRSRVVLMLTTEQVYMYSICKTIMHSTVQR